MEAFESTWIWVLFVFAIVIGFVLTGVYYFSRYYFKVSEKDKEVLKPLYPKTDHVEAPEIKNVESLSDQKLIPEVDNLVGVDTKSLTNFKSDIDISGADLEIKLANTKQSFWGRIKERISKGNIWESSDFESLEEILYTSDLGPQTVQRLNNIVLGKFKKSQLKDINIFREAIKTEMKIIFSEVSEKDYNFITGIKSSSRPVVIMIVGVNGAGKTTTIGKLANLVSSQQLKTLVVAGDTFRAAAREQLKVWVDRANVEIFNPGNTTDPSAVVFDGCASAKANHFDVVIIDTAGRLHTQENLMEELKKMKRVIKKVIPEAPHEVLIVLDANSGQNALVQAKMFNEALTLSGAILTKLDGTAKGGVAVGLACELSLPIRLIGVGEGINDIRNFQPNDFVDSIF
jgi:fused signal recognition particle receptor